MNLKTTFIRCIATEGNIHSTKALILQHQYYIFPTCFILYMILHVPCKVYKAISGIVFSIILNWLVIIFG